MHKFRALLVAVVAVAAAGFASANASAAISPGGAITASFPAGGLTFATPFSTTSCAISFSGTANATTNAVSVTSATITPDPCAGIAYRFLLPWSGSASVSGTTASITINDVAVQATIGGIISCLFSGRITLTGTNGAGTINAPSGTLTSSCGNAVVGGTGGTLSPAQTVS